MTWRTRQAIFDIAMVTPAPSKCSIRQQRCSSGALLTFWALALSLHTVPSTLNLKAMVFVRPTTAISRADLVQSCLQELRMWPGCESVGMIGVLAGLHERFTLHVLDYGTASKRLADRALRCIEREKLRRYHLGT